MIIRGILSISLGSLAQSFVCRLDLRLARHSPNTL
jgi:hypothetical protein